MKMNISDEKATERFGKRLGELLRGGETIELIGDVGAGKTTLTKSIARGMGIMVPILSPTFTISNRYDGRDAVLAHYDFYRLNDAGIMRDELSEVLDDRHAVTVIEWGDIVADVLPASRLTIQLVASSETARQLQITAHGEAMQRLMEQLT